MLHFFIELPSDELTFQCKKVNLIFGLDFPYTVALLSGKIAGPVRAYLVHELCLIFSVISYINVTSDFINFPIPLPSYPTTSKNAYPVLIASQMLIHRSLTHAQAHQSIPLVHAVVLFSEAF